MSDAVATPSHCCQALRGQVEFRCTEHPKPASWPRLSDRLRPQVRRVRRVGPRRTRRTSLVVDRNRLLPVLRQQAATTSTGRLVRPPRESRPGPIEGSRRAPALRMVEAKLITRCHPKSCSSCTPLTLWVSGSLKSVILTVAFDLRLARGRSYLERRVRSHPSSCQPASRGAGDDVHANVLPLSIGPDSTAIRSVLI